MECNLYCLTQLAKTCGLLLEHKKKKCPKKWPKKHKCPTTAPTSSTTTSPPTTSTPTTSVPRECCVPFRLPILESPGGVLRFEPDIYGNVFVDSSKVLFSCPFLDNVVLTGIEALSAGLGTKSVEFCDNEPIIDKSVILKACPTCTIENDNYSVFVDTPTTLPTYLDGVCTPTPSDCNCCVASTTEEFSILPMVEFSIPWNTNCVTGNSTNIQCDSGDLENLTMVITTETTGIFTFSLTSGACEIIVEVDIEEAPVDTVVSFNTCDCDTDGPWSLVLLDAPVSKVTCRSLSAVCRSPLKTA